MRKNKLLLLLLFIVPFLLLAVFFYVPVITVFITGFSKDGLKAVLADSYCRSICLFSLKQGALSTLLSAAIGFPGAYILARYSFRGKGFLKALITVPYVLPPIAAVLGIVLLIGNNGIINRALMALSVAEQPPLQLLYSLKAILIAHTFYNIPLFIRFVYPVWENIPVSMYEAGKSLGAGRWRLFRTVTCPWLLCAFIAACALIFVLCFMSFSIVLVLGGNPQYSTMEVEIYKLARTTSNITKACALGGIESLITLLFISLYTAAGHQQNSYPLPVGKHGTVPAKKLSMHHFPAIIYIAFLVIYVAMPMVTIALNSFTGKSGWGKSGSFTLNWYKAFTQPNMYNPVLNTLFIAVSTVICAIVLSIIISAVISRWPKGSFLIQIFFFASLGISSILLSLGFMLTISNLGFRPNGKLLLIAVHTAAVLPFTIKAISLFYSRINSRCIECAQSLGAKPLRILWTVKLPMIKNGIFTAGIFAFAVSAGEVNGALMLAPEGFTTMPVAIYRLIGAYRFYQACAMGTVLLLICIAAFYAIDRLGEINL
jgi:thiamine transport system permease protein